MISAPLILIPCAKTSKTYRCPAWEMYSPSVYFQKISTYASLLSDFIMILSSKYGLLYPGTIIDPYDEYLSTWAKARTWSLNVGVKLQRLVQWCGFRRVIFLTGQKYSRYLKSYLKNCRIDDPMAGLGIGQRLQWLTDQIEEAEAYW